jgi:hypothetical protein
LFAVHSSSIIIVDAHPLPQYTALLNDEYSKALFLTSQAGAAGVLMMISFFVLSVHLFR